jgi:hypothetical protein
MHARQYVPGRRIIGSGITTIYNNKGLIYWKGWTPHHGGSFCGIKYHTEPTYMSKEKEMI